MSVILFCSIRNAEQISYWCSCSDGFITIKIWRVLYSLYRAYIKNCLLFLLNWICTWLCDTFIGPQNWIKFQQVKFLMDFKFYRITISTLNLYTPCNEVRGGILESPCPSVCPAAFGFPAHNCFPFTPIIMTLHMQTPHESRMCPIDFEVKRSKVKVTIHKLLKMVSGALLLSLYTYHHETSHADSPCHNA